MPRTAESADARRTFATETWEQITQFLDDLRDDKVGIRDALHAIGGWSFSDLERDPLLEVLHRNQEVEGKLVVIVKRKDGSLAAQVVEKKRR